MRSPLERWAGQSAIVNADLGARVALQAVTELLYELGMNEAAEMVSDHGAVVVAKAFSEQAWAGELPPSGDTDGSTVNHAASSPQETPWQSHSTRAPKGPRD